jgi:hypothetical protein
MFFFLQCPQSQQVWSIVHQMSRNDDDDSSSVADDSVWPEFLTLPNVLEALRNQELLPGEEFARVISGLGACVFSFSHWGCLVPLMLMLLIWFDYCWGSSFRQCYGCFIVEGSLFAYLYL